MGDRLPALVRGHHYRSVLMLDCMLTRSDIRSLAGVNGRGMLHLKDNNDTPKVKLAPSSIFYFLMSHPIMPLNPT